MFSHHGSGNMTRKNSQTTLTIIGAFVVITVLSYYTWTLSSESKTLKRLVVTTYSKLKDMTNHKNMMEKKNTLLSNRMVEMEERMMTEKQNAETEQKERIRCSTELQGIRGDCKDADEKIRKCEEASVHRENTLLGLLKEVEVGDIDSKAETDIFVAKIRYLKDMLKTTGIDYRKLQDKYSEMEKEKIKREEDFGVMERKAKECLNSKSASHKQQKISKTDHSKKNEPKIKVGKPESIKQNFQQKQKLDVSKTTGSEVVEEKSVEGNTRIKGSSKRTEKIDDKKAAKKLKKKKNGKRGKQEKSQSKGELLKSQSTTVSSILATGTKEVTSTDVSSTKPTKVPATVTSSNELASNPEQKASVESKDVITKPVDDLKSSLGVVSKEDSPAHVTENSEVIVTRSLGLNADMENEGDGQINEGQKHGIAGLEVKEVKKDEEKKVLHTLISTKPLVPVTESFHIENSDEDARDEEPDLSHISEEKKNVSLDKTDKGAASEDEHSLKDFENDSNEINDKGMNAKNEHENSLLGLEGGHDKEDQSDESENHAQVVRKPNEASDSMSNLDKNAEE